MKHRLFIGTSGWNYNHWKNVFYPQGLAAAKWLEYYSGFFNTVELNVTFYRLVNKQTFQGWYRRTPKNFRFVIKGSSYITHIKRLNDSAEAFSLLMKNAGALKEKLAVILWQLNPGFKKDLKRLESFCEVLQKSGTRNAFEFRNASWFEDETYSLLRKYKFCLCIAHSGEKFPLKKEITSDFLYLRFHGGQSLYGSDYTNEELSGWSDFALSSSCRDIFAFFNNDARGYAVKNAMEFRKVLGKKR